MTGNYLIMAGDLSPHDILPLLRETFSFISTYQGEVPGATPKDCGNYSYMDLADAKAQASKFLDEILLNPSPENLSYPK